jgi:hypothetical protein
MPASLLPASLPPGPNSRATSTACSSARAGSWEGADGGEHHVKRSNADAHHQHLCAAPQRVSKPQRKQAPPFTPDAGSTRLGGMGAPAASRSRPKLNTKLNVLVTALQAGVDQE